MASRRTFAVVHCYVGDKWTGGSELWIDALRLRENGDVVTFDAGNKDEVPTIEDAHSGRFAGVIITGSQHGAYDTKPWILELTAFLKACLALAAPGEVGGAASCTPVAAPQLLGGCFGAQLLAHAAGGVVQQLGYFVLRAEALLPTRAFAEYAPAKGILTLEPCGAVRVTPPDSRALYPVRPPPATPDACELPVLAAAIQSSRAAEGGAAVAAECGASVPSAPPCPLPPPAGEDAPHVLRVLESHGDHVAELPRGAVLLATSASCGVEAFAIGDHVLAFQSHPEFRLEECVLDCVWPRAMGCEAGVPPSRRLTPAAAADAARSFALPRHDAHLLEVARRFITREAFA